MTSRKVLVIDDAETMRRAVVDALTPAGFTVITARDGFHGVAALKETHDLCLVIIDLNMPGMSGFGVLDWMRKDRSPHLPPAVFMTTEVSESALAQAKSAGAVGWLIKPCRADQLVSVVNRVLAKRGERNGS
ncbi:MAG TPA: response regulator [Polyangiaceae bacterium]|nr:response regulator [Polyangiaceae bacterium]